MSYGKTYSIPPEDRLAKKVLPGFDSTALQVLATELAYFIENQIVIADIFADKSEYTKELLLKEISERSKNTGAQELHRAISANGEMNFNAAGYLKISTDSNGLYHSKDLFNANLARAMSRVIIRSYANELERVNKLTGVTQAELQFWLAQLKELILNLELLEPERFDNFISSRFIEANLLLSVSNGDGLASFEEIDHLILHMISGASRAKSLQKIALLKCVTPSRQPLVKTELNEDCLLELYYNEENSFSDLPGFIKFKTDKDDNGELKTDREEMKKYYLNLLTVVGHVSDDNKIVYLGDANLFPHAVQYVEMIFFTHDANKNGFLEKEEAIKAYSVFQEMIKLLKNKETFKDLADKDFLGVFVWLLKKGTPFPIPAMKKFAKDYECNLKNDSKICAHDWTLSASRINIGKMFMLIVGMAAPKPPPTALSAPTGSVSDP